MADKEVSGLTAAATLDGTELVHLVQGGNSRQSTTGDVAKVAHTQAFSTITGTPTTLAGYGITDAQAKDSDLTAIAALSPSLKNVIIGNGTAWTAESGATFRASVGLAIGSDVQAYDADLTTLGGLDKSDGNVIIGNGTGWTVESGATLRSSFGLSIGSDVQAYSATLASLAGLTLTDGDILYSTGASALARLSKGSGGQVLMMNAGLPSWANVTGTGDMVASVYDPNAVGADAFSMDNMVEGADTKIMTAAERTKLASAGDMLAANNLSEVDPNAALKNLGAGVVLGTIAALQAFSPTTSPLFATVMGYASAIQPAGGGTFALDASDTTSADDGGMVIVDAAGRRWKRQATDMKPEYYGALGFSGSMASYDYGIAPVGYVDDADAIQKAIDYLDAKGGGVLDISRWHFTLTSLVFPYGVTPRAATKAACGIIKDSDTATTVTYYDTAATEQATIYPGFLPTSAKAVIILGTSFANGRWVGNFTGLTIGSTIATAGDFESQKNEFGILSVGSISDFVIDDNNVNFCEYAMMIPTPFVGQITNNRANKCLHGFGIGNCTTLTMHGNYANDCRDYGYAIRGGKYSSFFSNACDFLNDGSLYPDRTRECSAYILESCIGMNAFNNGQEGTLGNGWVLDSLRYCSVINNQSIRIGSDYSGANDIAFIKVKTALIGCTVTGNNGFDVNSSGLTFGSANAAKHHNLFQDGTVYWNGTTFHNNVVRAAISGLDDEAGWGNNNIQEALLVKRGGLFVGTDRNSVYKALIQGGGNTGATRTFGTSNSDGTVTFAVRDDGAATFPTVSTTAAAANVVFDGSNFLFKSTSLRSAKDNIRPIPLDEAMKFMQMDAQSFTSLCKADDPTRRMVGFIAEDAEKYAEPLAVYDKDGKLQGFAYDRAPAYHHVLLQHLLAEIEGLKARLT